jgi:hypothetical protein
MSIYLTELNLYLSPVVVCSIEASYSEILMDRCVLHLYCVFKSSITYMF